MKKRMVLFLMVSLVATLFFTNSALTAGKPLKLQFASFNVPADPTTKVLRTSGISPNGCGAMSMSGNFTSDLVAASGNYTYSRGEGGAFSGSVPTKE